MRLRLAFNSPKDQKISANASPFLMSWLNNREHILDSLLSNLDGMAYCCLLDEDWTMLYVSEGCLRLTGYKAEDFLNNHKITFQEVTHKSDRAHVRESIMAAIAAGKRFDVEYRIKKPNGAVRWVSERGTAIRNQENQVEALEGFIQDITARKTSELALQEAEKRYRSIFENTIEGIFQTSPEGKYLSANPALAKIYGFSSVEELIGSMNDIAEQLYVDHTRRQEFSELMLVNERVSDFESEIYRRDGSIIWISENARAVRNESGKLLYYEGTVEDITERKKSSELIEYQATHDDLTGLPNRALLKDRLHQAISNADRSDSQLAIVFVDLDHFKNINDTMGHHGGDQLLVLIAERLKYCVRESDTVARPGGDEFVLLLSNLHGLEALSQTLQRILISTAEPCIINEREFVVTCSLGISMYPEDGHDSETLLKNADTAMYKAKEAGKNNFQFFTPELNASLTERLELEYQMRNALAQKEFILHYQPKINLESGEITGMEALIRWYSPHYGFTSPAKFIPIAEETNLIEHIGEWVIMEACEQCMDIYKKTGKMIPVSVNVSARQFYHSALVNIVEAALLITGLNPACLEIEITEGTLIEQTSYVIGTLKNLRALGIKLSIDDFGTGYSSMSYLKHFPIDHLKIDQSFVRGLEEDMANQAILKAIVVLGHNLNLKVIAEGVETTSERDFLISIGCDEMQGYLFSKPLAIADLTAFVS